MLHINKSLYAATSRIFKETPFYYEVLAQTNYVESKSIPTAGVRFTKRGLEMTYNPDFFDKIKDEMVVSFILTHEVFHFLHNHMNRSFNETTNLRYIENIAMDMIINTLITRHHSALYEGLDFGDVKPFFIPPEYKGREIWEELYEWLIEEAKKRPEQEKGDSDDNSESGTGNESGDGENNQENDSDEGESQSKGKGSGGNKTKKEEKKDGKGSGKEKENDNGFSNETNDILDKVKKILEGEDSAAEGTTIDTHFDDEVPPEIREQIINDMIQTAKNRGLVTDNIQKILETIRASKKNYLKLIKQSISNLIGNKKRRTWRRDNRKELPFKGFMKYKNKINVIVDVSGSMDGSFEYVFSHLYHNGFEMNLIQADTEVKDVKTIRNKYKLQGFKIKGLGGTELQPALEYVKKNCNEYSNILLTDGYCDHLDFSGIKGKTLILTTATEVKYENGRSVRQILIKDEGNKK